MKRIFVLAAALIGCAIAAPAEAAFQHPFDEAYGYVAPKNLKGVRRAAVDSQQIPSMGWDWGQSGKQSNDDDNDDSNSKKNAKAPPSLTGGGQPTIAAIAPPKVAFAGYEPGSIVIDTAGRHLYYVLTASTAYSYPIAVGKQGFTWSGTEKISRKVAWPDWIPPKEMRARKAGLPERMAGGVKNPLGAMALYLGSTLYRIHGTNDAKSIGTAASSGCIRMTNGNVVHLAGLAGVGTTVHVLKRLPAGIARTAKADG